MINIQEAKTHLSRLLEDVGKGEEVVIAKAGKPIARLVPYREEREPRVLGRLAEHYAESEDCWDSEPVIEDSLDDPKLYNQSSPISVGIVADENPGAQPPR